MKLTPTCIACTLTRRAAELEHLDMDNRKKLGVYRDLLEVVNLYIGPDIEVAILESVVFRRFKTLLGGKNIYEDLVKQQISKALTRSSEIQAILEEKPIEERLRLALYTSTLATGYTVIETPERVFSEPPGPADLALVGSSIKIGHDDAPIVVDYLEKLKDTGGSIYYLFASVLELPYDKILVKILTEELGLDVIGVVRGERYRDYVIGDDLERHGLIEYLVEVIDTGSDILTVTKEENPHIYDQLNEASLVLVKGAEQSIYFHNNPLKSPTVFLFISPCIVISRAFNTQLKSLNIIARNIEIQSG